MKKTTSSIKKLIEQIKSHEVSTHDLIYMKQMLGTNIRPGGLNYIYFHLLHV